MNDFKIGNTNLDANPKRSGSKLKYLSVEGNKDGSPKNNYFRILPPMWSLAEEGRYFKYWRVHWGFTDTQGRPKPIACTERVGRDKVVYERCPICDMIAEAKKELDFLKDNGASEEELRKFSDVRIKPYEARGGYYVYALDAQGEVGILKLTKTQKDGFEEVYRRLSEEGIEANGIDGVYINIIRSGSGRFNTKYTVEAVMEADPNNPRLKGYKYHSLSTQLLEKLKNETVDLKTLYKSVSIEDMTLLVNESDPQSRSLILEKIFNVPERTSSAKLNNSIVSSVPEVPGAQLVGSMQVNQQTQKLEARVPTTPKSEVVSQPSSSSQASIASAAVNTPSANTASVEDIDSEEKFKKMFEERYGKQ